MLLHLSLGDVERLGSADLSCWLRGRLVAPVYGNYVGSGLLLSCAEALAKDVSDGDSQSQQHHAADSRHGDDEGFALLGQALRFFVVFIIIVRHGVVR